MAAVSLTKLLLERLGPGEGECEFSLASTRDARRLVAQLPRKVPLEPIFKDRSGGVFLRWNVKHGTPIVYLGTAGERYIAAESDRTVASLLCYGSGLHDCMAYWFHRLIEPSDAPPWNKEPAAFAAERGLSPAGVEAAAAAPDGLHARYLPTLLSAMKSLKIPVDPAPLGRVELASREFLASWIAACEP
jgi:hypothetical protein